MPVLRDPRGQTSGRRRQKKRCMRTSEASSSAPNGAVQIGYQPGIRRSLPIPVGVTKPGRDQREQTRRLPSVHAASSRSAALVFSRPGTPRSPTVLEGFVIERDRNGRRLVALHVSSLHTHGLSQRRRLKIEALADRKRSCGLPYTSGKEPRAIRQVIR